jgi:hypothetical protein
MNTFSLRELRTRAVVEIEAFEADERQLTALASG